MPPQWAKVKEIFHEAVELDGPSRSHYLDTACPDDAALRGEVERLLAWDTGGGEGRFTDVVTEDDGLHVFSPGELLGDRWEIVRFLGGGGMAEVYEAYDHQLGDSVALKTIRPQLAGDPRIRSRFKGEILLARKIAHRNVCQVFGLVHGEKRHPGMLAFTMRLLHGETLAACLKRRGRLDPAEALPLIRQMASGLAALHEEQVAHHDFKPGNVFVSRDEAGRRVVKITDFGLARLALEPHGEESPARRGIAGTPPYMAPEQLIGAEAGPPADIYAFGVVIYEMVTGAHPFAARTFEENRRQKCDENPRPPSEFRPDLPRRWESVILSCLEKDPAARPSSADAVAAALEEPRTWWKPLPARKRVAAFAMAVLLTIFLASNPAVFRYVQQRVFGAAHTPEVKRQHVAVLPFSVLGGDEELQVYSDGLMVTITQRLSQYERVNEQLLVVPPDEIRRRGVRDSAGAFKQFNTNYVVAGTVQAEDERIRLMLTVITGDANQSRQVDTDMIEDLRGNAFAIQDQAVARLATLLNLQVEPEFASRLASMQLTAPGAQDYFTQAQSFLQRHDKVDQINNAITLLDRVVQLDPNFVQAHAGLAEAYWRKYQRTHEAEWVEVAKEYSSQALALGERLPEVLVAVGRVQNGTGLYEEALATFNRAIELDPRFGQAYEGLGKVYFNLNRIPEAEAAFQKMISLRTADWRAYKEIGLFFYGQAKYEQAARYFAGVVNLLPDSAQAHVNLGAAYYRLGRLREAREAWETSVTMEPRASSINNLATLLMRQREYGEAARRYLEAIELNPNDFHYYGNLAAAYFASGDARTKQTYDEALHLTREELKVNPNREDLYSFLAHFAAGAGLEEEASSWLAKATARLGARDVGELIRNASTLEKLGRREEAIATVRRAVDAGASFDDIEYGASFRQLVQDQRYLEFRKRKSEESAED